MEMWEPYKVAYSKRYFKVINGGIWYLFVIFLYRRDNDLEINNPIDSISISAKALIRAFYFGLAI